MQSSYARKVILRSVAKMFPQEAWDWLATQAEFIEFAKTSESIQDMIKLGNRLCAGRVKPTPEAQPVKAKPIVPVPVPTTSGVATLAAVWPKTP